MSLVSSRISLIHRATVERDANAGTDDGWGNPLPPNFQTHLADQPCRFWATAGREVVANTTTVVVVEDMRLLLPVDTDVTVQDRIADVTYRGDVLIPAPAGIRAVLRRSDHLELVLASVA